MSPGSDPTLCKSCFLDLGVTSANANESVHYNHFNDGDSCHGRVERSLCPPSWVHVFAKSTRPSSIRTQAASIAYIKLPVHKKQVGKLYGMGDCFGGTCMLWGK